MNFPNGCNRSIPIINGNKPHMCDDLIGLLCDMYSNGEITENDDIETHNKHVKELQIFLREKSNDKKFVDIFKQNYKNEMNPDNYNIQNEDLIDDEEEQKILDEFTKLKT